MPEPIIHDGDHGSDDFVATLLLAARPDLFDLLGVATGFGNTSVGNAARNAGLALSLAGRPDVPVLAGSDRPLRKADPEGDNAFDEDGLGGAHFPIAAPEPAAGGAVAWMAKKISESPAPVTICATGLMTNIARLLGEHPDVRRRIGRIVAMGGCLGPLGPGGRCGNITPWAEFNFHMDPDAADFVLNSGVPVTLLPLDATHQTVFTPGRQRALSERLPALHARELTRMMRAAEKYDMPKFGLDGAAFHDQNVPLYLMAPHLYEGRDVTVSVNTDHGDERHGQMIAAREGGPVRLIERIADPDAAFALMLDVLAGLFPA